MKTKAKTVLVIEDERPIVRVLKGHLEGAGYRVLTALDGASGLALARSGGVDVITLDVLMEPVDGVAVFHALRDHPATRHVPIVLVTVVDTIPKGVEAEAYVAKPFRGQTLLDAIATALGVALGTGGA